MSTLSIAIIMKNEEKVVERCLGCVSKFADEVILVDTGSTDATKSLAAKFPKVQVFDSDFFNKDTHSSDFEFGKAKNEAIRKCTQNFVMWFDADDLMDDENIARLREIVDNETRVCLYSFEMEYGPLRFEHCRLFKNGAGILFDEQHGCHEYLNTLGHPLIIRRDIKIQHLPEQKGVPSAKRNVAILEKDYYVRKRDDPRTLFYLANGYREDNQAEKAIQFYDLYLGKSQWREERYFARFYKAQCLYWFGKFDESRDEICRAMAEDFRFAESHCFLGDVAFQKGDYELAILWFQMAMAIPYPKDSRLFVSSSSYSQYPTKRIGECLAKQEEVRSQKENPKPADNSVSVKRHEKFFLPKDRSLAMMAVTALSNCAMCGNTEVEIVTDDPWQRFLVKQFESLKIGEGEAKTLSLPSNLKGRHIVEWYIRSAGFMLPQIGAVRIANEVNRNSKFMILTEGISLPDNASAIILQEGKEVLVLKDDEQMDTALLAYKDAVAFIGKAGWLQHLAKWTRVPAFVFLDVKDEKEFGWPDQENRKVGDFTGIEVFLKRSLK